MQAVGGIARALEALAQALGHVLGVDKDHHALVYVAVEQIEQMLIFVLALGGNHVLGDLRTVFLRRGDDDLHRVLLVFPGDGHHVLVGGGGKEHQLPLDGRGLDNLGHILDKAHVEHFVGLVQHHGMHAVQTDVPAVHVVQQPSGRGHHDLRALLELGKLLGNRLPTIEAGDAHAGNVARQRAELVGDLQAQLARGGQHQLLYTLVLETDILQHGNAEGAGLARSRGGDGDQVAPLHHQGKRFGLDGGHFAESHFFDRLENLVAEIGGLGEFGDL